MVIEVKRSRDITRPVERELWARAAGRCQFDGCNKILYRSSVTNESVHTAQKAHIYSFSEKGPRGWGPHEANPSRLNDVSNLMLTCHECHTKIDTDPNRYSAEMLIQWKTQHEERVETVTGIASNKNSHVVMYGANIGHESSPLVPHDCMAAIFPHWYPASPDPIVLSMNSSLRDNSEEYWQAESAHLEKAFDRTIARLTEGQACKHFSLFALAPQPLLIKLGTLLTDKLDVETYQLHREPKGWRWDSSQHDFEFVINEPENKQGTPVLLLSLSDRVDHKRIHAVLGEQVSIWEITHDDPHNDFLKSNFQLMLFRQQIRKLMVEIKHHHGNSNPLHVFPVMPISCCIEMGRARMPKADMDWIIYDNDPAKRAFIKSLGITGGSHA